MKKLILALSIILFGFITNLYSQLCLPQGITFSTQEQIDNFQTDNPGCTEIEGSVTINGDNITNLNGLIDLTSIGGDLEIGELSGGNQVLSSFSGLDNLMSIGASLLILRNNSLLSLTGLENLESVGAGLWVFWNDELQNLAGLENLASIGYELQIIDNSLLTSIIGLSNLNSIGEYAFIEISDNDLLASLNGLEGLTTIPEHLWILSNNSLTDLSGLDNITSVGSSLDIRNNNSLINFNGLGNLTSTDHFRIDNNKMLMNLLGIERLTSVNNLVIVDNTELSSLNGLNNDLGIEGYLMITGNSVLSNCAAESICNYIDTPSGEIYISDNAVGCNSQEEVEEACETISIEELNLTHRITIYPNPFSISTTLSYSQKQPSTVQLSVFNQLGQLVYQHSEDQQQGSQQLQWDAQGQAEGLYYYRLQSGEQVANGKMVKVR